MTGQEYWAIIDSARHADPMMFYRNLIIKVSALPEEEKRSFFCYLGAYLAMADECVWVEMACKVINGYVGEDISFHFTLWLISQGEDVLLSALRDPDSLAALPDIPFGHADFEALMDVVLGENADTIELRPPQARDPGSSETMSAVYRNGEKLGGYDSLEEAMEDIPNVLPSLIARASECGFDWRHSYAPEDELIYSL